MTKRTHLRFALLAALVLPVASCAVIADAPIVSNGPAAAAGTRVALGQPVWTGQIVATPIEVHEDSRCPINARCIRAGRVIVLTRIDGAGWRESVYLQPDEPHETHGTSLTLTSVTPERTTDTQIRMADYRFAFEGGN